MYRYFDHSTGTREPEEAVFYALTSTEMNRARELAARVAKVDRDYGSN